MKPLTSTLPHFLSYLDVEKLKYFALIVTFNKLYTDISKEIFSTRIKTKIVAKFFVFS